MPCEDRHTRIGDHKFTVTQMAPSESLELESRFAPLLMKGLASVFAGAGKSEQEQLAQAISGLGSIFETIPSEEIAEIIRSLCSQCFIDGERVNFERDFQGGKGVMLRYRVAWFVLEANYSDFFGELLPAGLMVRARKLYEKWSTEEGSTGESGDPVSPSLRSAS